MSKLDEASRIIEFIKNYTRENREKGPRYTEMTKHLEGEKGWTHGTFQKRLDLVMDMGLVERRLDVKIGRNRYYISKERAEEVGSVLVKAEVAKSCTNEIPIPENTIKQAMHRLAELRSAQITGSAGFLTKLKLKKKEFQFFQDAELQRSVESDYPALSVNVACPPGAIPPEIPEWGIEYLIAVLLAPTGFDEKSSRFQIILSCDLSARRLSFLEWAKTLFVRWAKEARGVDIDENMLPYLWPEQADFQVKTKDDIPLADELLKLGKLQREFMKLYNDYLTTFNQGARRTFRGIWEYKEKLPSHIQNGTNEPRRETKA
jgi:hypothetical protein